MKKHQLKNYLKLGILLFGILTLAIACQKDDEFIPRTQSEADSHDHLHQENLPRGINVQTIDFGNAPHKNQLIEKLNGLVPQDSDGMASFSNDNENSLLYGLNIEQDSVVFATFGNKYSYTFATWRDYETPLLENLVLTYNNQNNNEEQVYTAYLIRYDFEQGNINAVNVEEDLSAIVFSDGTGCGWSTVITPCSSGQHDSSNIGSWSQCIASTKPTIVMTENLCEGHQPLFTMVTLMAMKLETIIPTHLTIAQISQILMMEILRQIQMVPLVEISITTPRKTLMIWTISIS